MSDLPCESQLSNIEQLVTQKVVDEIIAYLKVQPEINETVMAELRNDYPNLRFTLCFDTEMGARDAFAEYDGFDLYLVAHSQVGCSSLTDTLSSCTGFVIALHDE